MTRHQRIVKISFVIFNFFFFVKQSCTFWTFLTLFFLACYRSAADDHANFTTSSSSDRFGYDRSTSSRNTSAAGLSASAASGDVGSDFRRGGGGGYHDPTGAGGTSRSAGRNRGDRDRDRSYRSTNGPSSTYLDTGSGNRITRTTATAGGGPATGAAPSSAGTTTSWSSYESTR